MEKAPKARVPDLDKRKYLVPSDLTGNALCLDPPVAKHSHPPCMPESVMLREGRGGESEWEPPELEDSSVSDSVLRPHRQFP